MDYDYFSRMKPRINSDKEQGTSRPHWGRSAEYLLAPVTMQFIYLPPEHSLDIFRGKSLTTTPFFTLSNGVSRCGDPCRTATPLQQVDSMCLSPSIEPPTVLCTYVQATLYSKFLLALLKYFHRPAHIGNILTRHTKIFNMNISGFMVLISYMSDFNAKSCIRICCAHDCGM